VASATMSSGVLADAPTESDYSDILSNMDGEGTSSNPHVVTTLEELQAVKGNLSAYYVLGNDINASETENWNNGAGFTPIGNVGDNFAGNFDGKGYTIDRLYINRPNAHDVGLFGVVNSGDIKNIGVTNIDIQGDNDVGGLVGDNRYSSYITNSYSSGEVTGVIVIGGLVGDNIGTIEKSYSNSSVTGEYDVGGLVGHNTEANITKSYSSGTVTGDSAVGGLVGDNNFGGNIMKSYSSGNVSGNEEVGGLVGRNDIDATVADSYWDTETSNQATSAGSVIGLTTAEITGSAASTNMVNLDFTSEWSTVLASDTDSSADSYPIIQSNDRKAQLVSAGVYGAPTSSVDVIVEDSDGNAISGATVDIDGTDGATQDLADGQYNITASANGYDTLSEDITVYGAAETVTVTLLEESTYSINVLAVDSEGNAITEYTVESDGTYGKYFANGTYTITASADGYDTLNKDVTVDGAAETVTVTLSESTYSVDVFVEDSGGNAISGATVEIDGTDGAIQDLTDGQYNITASADGYDTLSQDITVDGAAETVTVTLSEEEEDVIFSESSSEEDIAVSSTLVYASVVAFFGIFIMVVFLFGKD